MAQKEEVHQVGAMRVNVFLATGFVCAFLLVCAVNVVLQRRNEDLAKQRDSYRQYVAEINGPAEGTRLPDLTGTGPEGPWKVSLEGPARSRAILLFSVNCHYSDQNWASWETLLNDPEVGQLSLLLTTSQSIKPEYLALHNVANRKVLVGLDAQQQASFHLIATPQTIVERDGIVERVWPGVLTDSDIREIVTALKR